MKNTQVILARRPQGAPVPADFAVREVDVPAPGEGEALLENLYVSLDAGFRNWMDEDAGDEVLPAMQLGDAVMGLTASRVVQSNRTDLTPGQILVGRLAWESYSIAGEGDLLDQVAPEFSQSPNLFLGLLGDTGLSAYFGLIRVAKVQPGDTVLVSAAGGAVGNVAGQVAKILGASRVVGFAGSDEKCRWLEDEVGYDATINYRQGNVTEALARACPDGVDVYFDNVGGDLLEPVLNHINQNARIAFCGAVADYNDPGHKGPANLFMLVTKTARLEGFMTHFWMDDYTDARRQLLAWLEAGKLKKFESVYEGVELCGQAFADLFAGKNHGKTIVKV